MPNYCMNSIKITGDYLVMSSLFDQIKERKEFLNIICPIDIPEDEEGFPLGAATNFWGTKWDVDTCFLNFKANENGDGVIFGSFESAWSPPIEALATFESTSDVDVDLKYFEPGMMFCGWYTKGEDFCMDIQSTDEEWVTENIPEEIIEEFSMLETFDEWQQEYDEEFGSDTLALEYKPEEDPSEDAT